MNYLFFGDDWGRHPSTTQHLARALDAQNIVWVNSIGMRSPTLCAQDIKRVIGRIKSTHKPAASQTSAAAPLAHMSVLSPTVLPWHTSPQSRQINEVSIKRSIAAHTHGWAPEETIIISASPVLSLYERALPQGKLVYLRLDDYADLPGVDPALVAMSEPLMYALAELVVAPARPLLTRAQALGRPTQYLPQGVELDHFKLAPCPTTSTKTLGFFGLLASWLDTTLITQVARALPSWTLEFIGPHDPATKRAIEAEPNIRIIDPVPYHTLPEATAHWSAAWIPFERSKLTAHVNPLKLREYLAMGLPTASTFMPEAQLPCVQTVLNCVDVTQWLKHTVGVDDDAQRQQRRHSVTQESWRARAQTLQDRLSAAPARRQVA